jgi:hypothetical protein
MKSFSIILVLCCVIQVSGQEIPMPAPHLIQPVEVEQANQPDSACREIDAYKRMCTAGHRERLELLEHWRDVVLSDDALPPYIDRDILRKDFLSLEEFVSRCPARPGYLSYPLELGDEGQIWTIDVDGITLGKAYIEFDKIQASSFEYTATIVWLKPSEHHQGISERVVIVDRYGHVLPGSHHGVTTGGYRLRNAQALSVGKPRSYIHNGLPVNINCLYTNRITSSQCWDARTEWEAENK